MTKPVVFVSVTLTMVLIRWRCSVEDIILDLPCRLQKACHMKPKALFLAWQMLLDVGSRIEMCNGTKAKHIRTD